MNISELYIDKKNGDIAFNEEYHKYFNIKHPDRIYTSVTTLIGKYYPHFDEEFWSRYKALQKLIGEDEFDGPDVNKKTGKRSPASEAKKSLLEHKVWDDQWCILYDIDTRDLEDVAAGLRAEYKEANVTANIRGTAYHNMKENMFYEAVEHNLAEYNFNLPITTSLKCERHNFDLTRDEAIIPELLMYFSTEDTILNLAGQADLIYKKGNDIYILDYKTNAKGMGTEAFAYFDKNIKRRVTEKMFYPINNLDNHMLNHYTLQLSIYGWMIQKLNPDLNIKLLRLLHVDGEGVETHYDVPYLKKEVERMLKHYKQQLKIDYFRDTGKMIK